jgi:hypothetical protein
VHRIIVGLLGLLVLITNAKAQTWMQKQTPDFTYYFKESDQQFVQPFDSIVKVELRSLQKVLNYHATQPIDIFIVSEQTQFRSVERKIDFPSLNTGGVIPLHKNRVLLHTSYSPQEITAVFRKELAEILITEMMFGGSLQDNIKNANLIQLPAWAIPGLIKYLAQGWSPALDNDLRILYAENQLINLNTLNPSQMAIMGASFWHFIEQVQGKSAIPTLLYMARLSRKFNSALFYAFQWSLSDLYHNWLTFYKNAYTKDLRKANPVEGMEFRENVLLEWYAKSKREVYTLERKNNNVNIFQYSSGTKNKIYTLKNGQQPLPPFSGALWMNQGPQLVVYQKGKAQIITIGSRQKQQIGLAGITKVVNRGDSVLFLKSTINKSSIYKWQANQLTNLWDTTCYIEDMAVANDGKVVVQLAMGDSTLFQVRDRSIENVLHRLQLPYKVRQPIWADNQNILFNHLKNGIWNGGMWNLEAERIQYVTDYGLNIEHHSYNNQVFAELIDNGSTYSMPITENLMIEDFFVYDTLIPAYFAEKVLQSQVKEDSYKTEIPDSLMSYSFQSPINPKFDFTSSNYDSLFKANEAKIGNLKQSVPAKERFTLSRLLIQANNHLTGPRLAGFSEAVSTITPNNLNVCLGFDLKNQFNNKTLRLGYEGMVQPGAHQLDVGYTKEAALSYGFSYMHRRRLLLQNSQRVRYTTDFSELFVGKTFWNTVHTSARLRLTNFQKNPLASSIDDLVQNPVNRQLYALSLQAFYINEYPNATVTSKAAITPIYNQSPSANFMLSSRLSYAPMNWFHFSGRVEAAKSVGNNPTFFSLGGAAFDLTNRHQATGYTDYFNAASYQMVTGIRGFNTNARNGTTYGLLNIQADIKPLHLAIKRPIVAEMFNNFSISTFIDMGTAFFGSSSYHPANTFGTRTISSSTGSVVAEVKSYQNPVMLGTGVGLSTQMYGYRLRMDYAFGFEEFIQTQTNWHIGIGRAF